MKLSDVLSHILPAQRETGAFAAVTVPQVSECCAAAKATVDHPILLSTHPELPLPGCTMPQSCVCRFRIWPDRRIGDRRFKAAEPADALKVKDDDKRQIQGRRSTDRPD